MQRIVRWSLAVSVFLAVSYTLAYVPRWYRNVQRSGRLDPRPVRWEGGHLKSPPEPSWDAVRRWEDNLPQHNLSLPFPEGRNGRYVKFSTQPGGLGWNNVFTELILCAHLAYDSGRAYVFRDYSWAINHYPWPIPVWKKGEGAATPRTPLSALISGPTAGGNWPAGDDAPRSISERWWDTVCEDPNDVEILWSDDAKRDVGNAPGDEVLRHWSRLLRESPKKCIDVRAGPSGNDGFPQTFDLWLVGSSRMVPLWDIFKDSPTSRLLAASPIVASAVTRNEHLFLPRGPRAREGSPDPFARMMAVHMRRGDYEGSCRHFAKWSSSFYGWNQLPVLPDPLVTEPGGESEANTAIVMRRCWPTVKQALERVREAREAYEWDRDRGEARPLDVIHVLSEGDGGWLRDFQDGLRADGWGTVILSKDLVLDSEQTGVGMAVDMEIARKAAVFIGNGWSSFTSNIIHRRLVDGREPIANRFW
ncbi:hypothetical protein PUNSTDRAFT_63013 [Punctularia strigosozonata HHB-11173 SS5]|uniref:uncharacterized protein n=1 Tax=Punctularia strigosozonata (strain HHB-11173) TaxID=741275 RepID=UPI0004416E9B|nr:uncharacterized protein PUNSTDRAFT_63013 [Punctularia strigosozonata HHB-11173 SS5]EIN11683.1 hypothetical protein PUNSTDRAFT_63013 [Punctularia strigosozonata HHB-11173 SS5]